MLYRFVSGDLPITLLLYGVLYLWAASHRSLLSAIAFRDTAIWNRIGQATLIVVGIFPLWVALADNWRHLLAYGLPVGQRWKSDPFEAAATAEPLRLVTLALLGLGLLGTALLFARHRGSLPTALLTAALGLALFYFLNPIRMRVDVYLVTTQASLEAGRVFDVAFILFWAAGLYLLIGVVIAAAAALLFFPVALPVRLIHWLATRGRGEREAEVFRVFQTRARSLHAEVAPGRRPQEPESHADGEPGVN